MVDVEETQRTKSTHTVVYQDTQEEIGDEVQQGGGNVLGTCGAIASGGESGGNGGNDDDEDPKKKKDSIPTDKAFQKEKPIEEEEEEEFEILASTQKTPKEIPQ